VKGDEVAVSMTADEWNERHPSGTAVRYYPVRGDMYSEDTETRSEAWELGHGAPVVKVVGRTGGVLLEHLQVI